MPESATFDTHAWVKRLQQAGVPEQQAEAHVEMYATEVERRLVTRDHFDRELQLTRDHFDQQLDYRLLELEHRIKLWVVGAAVTAIAVLGTLMTVLAFMVR